MTVPAPRSDIGLKQSSLHRRLLFHNNHKIQRRADNNDHAAFVHCRQRLVSYEIEEELKAKMNALYEGTVSMDQDGDEGEDEGDDDSLQSMNNTMVSNAAMKRTVRKVRFQESFRRNSKRRAIEPIPFPTTSTTTSTPSVDTIENTCYYHCS
jgi:hypothetical protein